MHAMIVCVCVCCSVWWSSLSRPSKAPSGNLLVLIWVGLLTLAGVAVLFSMMGVGRLHPNLMLYWIAVEL